MKNLLLAFTLFSGFAFGQFTISESSQDWQTIGKIDAAELSQKDNTIKIRFVDYQSKLAALDSPIASMQSRYQRNVDKVEKAIEKGNKGIKDSAYEFQFSVESSTLNKIYSIIEDHFKDKNKEELTLSFPEGNLYLKFDTSFGMYLLSLGIDSDNGKIYTTPMTKKQASKLLGQK